MIIFLAAYDPGVERALGDYWAWAHPNIPADLLRDLYYNVLQQRKPEDPNTLGSEDVVGGCARLDDRWCCWYRFFNGDRDTRGRPGRFVVVAALLEPGDLTGRDWTGFLRSPLMQELGNSATTCPMPAPSSLETTWDRPAVVPTEGLRMRMNGKTSISLSANEIGQALRVVTGKSHVQPFWLEIDWIKDEERTQLNLTTPILCLPAESCDRPPMPAAIERPVRNERTADPLTIGRRGNRVAGAANDSGDSRWKDIAIILLAIAVLLLASLLAWSLLSGRTQRQPMQPTNPTIPTEPVVPRREPKRYDAQAPIEEKILTYVYYHQMLCSKDGPSAREIQDFFKLTDGQAKIKLDGLVRRHKLRRIRPYLPGGEHYELDREEILPEDIVQLPHLIAAGR